MWAGVGGWVGMSVDACKWEGCGAASAAGPSSAAGFEASWTLLPPTWWPPASHQSSLPSHPRLLFCVCRLVSEFMEFSPASVVADAAENLSGDPILHIVHTKVGGAGRMAQWGGGGQKAARVAVVQVALVAEERAC